MFLRQLRQCLARIVAKVILEEYDARAALRVVEVTGAASGEILRHAGGLALVVTRQHWQPHEVHTHVRASTGLEDFFLHRTGAIEASSIDVGETQSQDRLQSVLVSVELLTPAVRRMPLWRRAVQKESSRPVEARTCVLYFVWLPMLPSDHEGEATGMAQNLAGRGARHFYDPQRRAGIVFFEITLRRYARGTGGVAAEHPFRKRLAAWAAAPQAKARFGIQSCSSRPARMALNVSPAGLVDEANWFLWRGRAPQTDGQFLRNHIRMAVESDWFVEAREGMKLMRSKTRFTLSDQAP